MSSTNRLALVNIIKRYPGLDAIALKGKGWRPILHGSLRDAESMGLLTFRNGGWYVAEDTAYTDCLCSVCVKLRRYHPVLNGITAEQVYAVIAEGLA
jgi:hypothetical protein